MAQNKKKKERKKGLLTRIILIINFLAIFFLLLAYLSLFISPEKNWTLPFFGLLYPYFLFANIVFILYWAIRLRWTALFSLIAVLIGWNIIWRTIQVEVSSDPLPPGYTFQVMSYNVKNMSNNNLLIPDESIRGRILKLLKNNRPDILCLQEFESDIDDPLGFVDSMATILGLPYHEFARYNQKSSKRLDAIITFSKFPVLSSRAVKKDALHNYCLINDLLIGQDTVRLFNIHLESVRFRPEDYTFINDLDLQFEENEDLKEGSRRIFNKLRQAYIKRSSQVSNLKELLRYSPYPVILCGDFNDTPCSYTYQVLSKGMKDAFIERGSGLGNTYAGTLPSLRIDNILYDPVYRAFTYTIGREELSDHYPVAARLGKREAL